MADPSPSQQIDDIIQLYGGWKGAVVSRLRTIILAADPDIAEEVKWKMPTRPQGLPVWSHGGMVCFAEIWKDNVKLLFPKGAELKDPNNLFNARLQSADIRAIEFRESDTIDNPALTALIHEAVKLNQQ